MFPAPTLRAGSYMSMLHHGVTTGRKIVATPFGVQAGYCCFHRWLRNLLHSFLRSPALTAVKWRFVPYEQMILERMVEGKDDSGSVFKENHVLKIAAEGVGCRVIPQTPGQAQQYGSNQISSSEMIHQLFSYDLRYASLRNYKRIKLLVALPSKTTFS